MSISTGIMIHPKYWNVKSKDKHFRKSDDISTDNLNTRLKNIESSVLAAYNDHINNNGALYTDRLKRELKGLLRPKGEISDDGITFVKGFEIFIQASNRSLWTRKHYRTALNSVEKYEKTLRDPLTLEDIGLDFYANYVRWCEKVPYALNTIGSHIKEIKVFMSYAVDKGWTTNVAYRHRKFKVLEETSDSIVLSIEQIQKIYEHDFSKRPDLERERDLFVVDCFTGLRYQDLHQITMDKFIENGTMIKVKTQKTGKMVIIPLHDYVKEILNKYDSAVPAPTTDQHMNRMLKIIGRLSKLQDKVSKTITIGGVKVTKSYFEWQLITVHTARRSFATNATLAGVPRDKIMMITGHSTEKSFNKYVKVDALQNANLIKDHEFFKKRPALRIAR